MFELFQDFRQIAGCYHFSSSSDGHRICCRIFFTYVAVDNDIYYAGNKALAESLKWNVPMKTLNLMSMSVSPYKIIFVTIRRLEMKLKSQIRCGTPISTFVCTAPPRKGKGGAICGFFLVLILCISWNFLGGLSGSVRIAFIHLVPFF